MRRVVTSSQMREMDKRAMEEAGIHGLLLMENAGLGVVGLVEEVLGGDTHRRVLIFCGRGNNGGDGMVAARHLFNRGYPVNVYLTGKKKDVPGDALENIRMLEGMGIDIVTMEEKKDLRRIRDGDLIVDALLGTGITGKVRGVAAEVMGWMNRSSLPVVSVDIPSGLHSDDGTFQGICVQADYTATMAELKRGLVLPPGREMAGEVTVVDIGSPESVSKAVDVKTFLLDKDDIVTRLPCRPADAHKGDFGKILVLAGSPGLTGAAALASMASLRVGGGLTVLGIPKGLNSVMEEKLTEVMTKPLPDTAEGTLSLDAGKDIDALLDWADVLAIGPGISTIPETSELVRRVVHKTKKPVVIDADGLNAFEGKPELLEKGRGRRVLTPHYGELSRIIGLPIEDISKQRIEVALEYAHRFQSVLVLKGAPTVIAEPDGNVFINPTGNSGMATAGAGDVLTGMIVGFLGQRVTPLDAALSGVFLHGVAGDVAAQTVGERFLIAGDLIDSLPEAFRWIED